MVENTVGFDRSAHNLGNILLLEHVNLAVTDQLLAISFYVEILGFTRDPYLSVGLNNIWINAGRQQFHLPTSSHKAQVLRGEIGLIFPSLHQLRSRLSSASKQLKSTEFSWSENEESINVICPWGNRFICREADINSSGMKIGIPYINLKVPTGAANGISRFYKQIFGTPSHLISGARGLESAVVKIGLEQSIVFTEEKGSSIDAYDGHHIAIYVSNFSAPHFALKSSGFITEESNEWQYRFESIYDPDDGTVLYNLEHEVRSATHPMFARNLINRNPNSNLQNFLRGSENMDIG